MNAKALGGGALLVLGIGGFFLYNELEARRAKKEAEEEIQRSYEADATKKAEVAAARGKTTWVDMPDLKGMTEAEAKAALVAAKFTDAQVEVREANYICDYPGDVDDQSDMVAVDTICNQEPSPNARVRGEKLTVKVTIEHDTFEHGGAGTVEWRRMPNVEGMGIEEAKALLASKGFGADEFEIEDHAGGCDPGTVCETRPKGGDRKRKDSPGVLHVATK